MIKTKKIMGMLATINITDPQVRASDIDGVFAYFEQMDLIFSTYKKESYVEKIKRGEVKVENSPQVVKEVFGLAESTKKETGGYFDIYPNGQLDPSGLVKGYSIHQGAKMLQSLGYHNYFVEIAGDIQVEGKNDKGDSWTIGIQNPFYPEEIIKVVNLSRGGIATSGTYQRGDHIYNPLTGERVNEIMSLTVIGPNIYEADRFATGAFAMGKNALHFIASQPGLEGYLVGNDEIAYQTEGFGRFVGN